MPNIFFMIAASNVVDKLIVKVMTVKNMSEGTRIFFTLIDLLYVKTMESSKTIDMHTEIPALALKGKIIGNTIIITIPAPKPVIPCTIPAITLVNKNTSSIFYPSIIPSFIKTIFSFCIALFSIGANISIPMSVPSRMTRSV